MAVTYPAGYGIWEAPLDVMMAEVIEHGHPEYVRRLRLWLIDQAGRVGIGDAWRLHQPNKPGFAPEGQSFHQTQRFASGILACSAVDLVVKRPGAQHRSPTWKEVPARGSDAAKKYGLHCNISSEPWHMQPVELDGWGAWVNNGRRDPVANYGTPGEPPPPGMIKDPPPASLVIDQPLNTDTLLRTRWLQQIGNERGWGKLTVDGLFGKATEGMVATMQRTIGAFVDGEYGPKTAGKLAVWLGVH